VKLDELSIRFAEAEYENTPIEDTILFRNQDGASP
jgi:hypothetical protein